MFLSNKRPWIGIVLALSVVFLPYWIYLPLIFLAIILVPFYFEAIVLAFFGEMLYGLGSIRLPMLALVLVVIMIFLHDRLRLSI